MSKVKELLMNGHIQMALAVGISIIALSYVSKRVLPVPMKPIYFSLTSLIMTAYEAVVHNNADKRRARTRYWVPAVLLTMVAVIAGHILAVPPHSEKVMNSRLAGCWRGGMVRDGFVEENEVRLFSLRPDSSLAITIVYETGPRSRVWMYDIDIEYRGRDIRWDFHSGSVSAGLDTIDVVKDYKGERSRWIFVRCPGAEGLMSKLSAAENGEYRYSVPEELKDGWNCAGLETVKIESGRLTGFMEEVSEGKHGDIHGILIVKDRHLALEEHFACDGRFHGGPVEEIFRDRVHHLASVTKGILSLVTGIALDEGYIESVETPVIDHLPGYGHLKETGKGRIRFADLLTMRSGLQWDQFKHPFSDPRNDGGELLRCEDVIGYILEKPLVSDPGKVFNYSNADPLLLSEALAGATGIDTERYAAERLFKPLGIFEYYWGRYRDGTLETDGGLALRPRDLARVGQLLLDNGKCKDLQLVPGNWIAESTRRRCSIGDSRWYGYYWNQKTALVKGRSVDYIFVPGDGGQFLAVFPEQDMVIVMTSGNYGRPFIRDFFRIVQKNILPAVVK